MKKALKQLKESFEPYSLLWEEWIKYKHCGLSEEDIYIIQVQINNDFKITLDEAIMFYNKPRKIYKIILKLDSDYPDFQDWVLSKFLPTLVCLAIKNDLQPFIETPIILLSINDDLKECLRALQLETLKEIIETYSEQDFKTRWVFKNVVEFVYLISAKEQETLNICH